MTEQTIVEKSIYPRPLTLGKGVRGKLQYALGESELPYIDYFDRKGRQAFIVGGTRLVTPLPSEEDLQDMSDGEFSGFNKLFPQFVEAFLIPRKFYVEEFYLEGVPTGNNEHVLPILFDIYRSHEREGNDGVIARVVFGASEEMSLRSLSYMLPVLLHMERLQKEAGYTIPQLQLIFAKHTGGGLNGLDQEAVAQEAALFARVASALIQKYFPALRDKVIFLEDTPLADAVYKRQLQEVTTALDGQTDFTLLEEKAATRRTAQTAKMYGAAHVVLHETSGDRVLRPLVDTNGQEIFPDQTILSATGIINYGGIQELPFYALRQEARLISSLSILPSIQFFTRHHVPPYFMSEGGDLGLREALALPRDERRKRLKALAPTEDPGASYQTRGSNGAIYEDLYFLSHIIDDREEDHRVTSALDTFLDEQADMAKTI